MAVSAGLGRGMGAILVVRDGARTARHGTRGHGLMSGPVNRRPKLELRGSSASPEEAAAVIAAIERFIRDTAPPVASEPEGPSPWMRAARLEGVDREPTRGWI